MVPKQVKIHFLDRTQRGSVRVRNGLSETVHLSRIDYDKTRFELLESGASVAPGQDLRLLFRHIGKETKKPLRSEVRLFLKPEDEPRARLVPVPILYNFVSRGARSLLGLTGEKLKNLKRGETVKSVIPTPEAGIPPTPTSPPQSPPNKNRTADFLLAPGSVRLGGGDFPVARRRERPDRRPDRRLSTHRLGVCDFPVARRRERPDRRPNRRLSSRRLGEGDFPVARRRERPDRHPDRRLSNRHLGEGDFPVARRRGVWWVDFPVAHRRGDF